MQATRCRACGHKWVSLCRRHSPVLTQQSVSMRSLCVGSAIPRVGIPPCVPPVAPQQPTMVAEAQQGALLHRNSQATKRQMQRPQMPSSPVDLPPGRPPCSPLTWDPWRCSGHQTWTVPCRTPGAAATWTRCGGHCSRKTVAVQRWVHLLFPLSRQQQQARCRLQSQRVWWARAPRLHAC